MRSLYILFGVILILSFQNCSDVSFEDQVSASTAAGDLTPSGEDNGVNNPGGEEGENELGTGGENCVPGRRLSVWRDPNRTGDLNQSQYLGSFVSYTGSLSAKDNYNYYSHSAHPIVGPSPKGFLMNVFFYEDAQGLYMNFFANKDEDGTDGDGNTLDLDIKVEGNSNQDDVVLSDDNAELKKVSSAGDSQDYEGRFWYKQNTDGGVVGPFMGENYKITVDIKVSGDIGEAQFFSSNGSSFDLTHQDKVSSFIITFQDYEDCN